MADSKGTASRGDQLKAMNAFFAKSDARDKLCATIQYALLFAHAGQAGKVKKAQAAIAASRKVFRILKPVEALTPILADPFARNASKDDPASLVALRRLQSLCMALYFGGDHVAWSKSAGLIESEETASLAQKVSMYSWFMGSVCKALSELYELSRLSKKTNDQLRGLEEEDARSDVRARADAVAAKRSFTVAHACVQATLALGLAKAVDLKPRTLGALGVAASVMNLYMMLPGSFKPALKAKAA